MKSTGAVENEGDVPYPKSPGGGRDITDVVVLSCPRSLCDENPEQFVLLFEPSKAVDLDMANFWESELLYIVEGELICPDLRRRAFCRLLKFKKILGVVTVARGL